MQLKPRKPAFAKLMGKTWSYFLRNLVLDIGRDQDSEDEEEQNADDEDEAGEVDVDGEANSEQNVPPQQGLTKEIELH